MSNHTVTVGKTTMAVDAMGAWVTKLSDKDSDILFPRQLFELPNGETKLRGGCHVCAPQFGPSLEEMELAQHGFGRDDRWALQSSTDTSVTFSLAPTHKDYVDLQMVLVYTISEKSLRAELSLYNDSSHEVRVAPGFHPYFATTDAATIGVDDETVNVDAHHDMETMLGTMKQLEINRRTITISSDELSTWALWSDRLDDYFCVEPTLGGNRFLNKAPQEDELLAPGAHASYTMTISWE